ncbi:MAG TPA: DUF4912 domain-containing protein [Myxococcales bacterium]|jgi:hypothetical protein|nr:DUF4912 domain-containing protein [Myxococcales bacterium]
MPEKNQPPRPRPSAQGREEAVPQDGVDPSRRAALEDEPREVNGREQPAGGGTQAEEAREIARSAAQPAPQNGDLHHEVPAHPGVPLAPPGIVPESDVRTHSPAAAMPPKEHGFVEELGELPWTYGDGRLLALIRDPQTIYVYWDLSQQQIEQAFGGLGTSRASLKLWNVRGNELLREVEVHLESRGWYVRELPSALELRVELWALGDRGARMLRAARPIKLPPAQPSDVLDEVYATLPLGSALRGEPVAGGRPLAWKSGGAPPGWERRMQPRHSSTSRTGGQAPSSGTLQKKDEEP